MQKKFKINTLYGFYESNSADPDEMPHAASYLGLHYWFPSHFCDVWHNWVKQFNDMFLKIGLIVSSQGIL